MTTIWKEPPAPAARGRKGGTKYAELVAELKAHPGKWALVAEGLVNRGPADYIRKQGLEVTTRIRQDGKYDVYARGPEAAEDKDVS